MKYIRTQVGIFEEEYVHIKINLKGQAIMEYKGKFYEPPLEVKQADTIEELCDEFVIRWSNKTYCDNLMKTLRQARYWLVNDSNAEIYGAIWTDKGLIYVAKMNNKGELELL